MNKKVKDNNEILGKDKKQMILLTLYAQPILLQDATPPPIYYRSLQILSILGIL